MTSHTLKSVTAGILLPTLPAWLFICVQRYNTALFVGDDAYMTFKVARNLLQGLSCFIYNQGEFILGTTTPLWAAVLAGLSWIFAADPLTVFRPAGIFLDLLNCILITVLASSSGRYPLRGLSAALLFSLSWHMNYASTVGMETNFFISLLLISVLLQQTESLTLRIVSAIIAAATFMTRPEGAFLLLGIGICRLVRDRKLPWPEIIAGTVLVGSYLAYMLQCFGSIIPHAGVAKSVAYHRQPLQAFFALGDHIGMFTLTPLFDDPGTLGLLLPYCLWGLWGIGVYVGSQHSFAQAILGIFSVAVLALYSLMNPLLFEWYVVPLEVSYAVSLVWGVCAVVSKIAEETSPRLYTPVTSLIAVTIFVIGAGRYEFPTMALELAKGPGGYRHWPSLSREFGEVGKMRLPVLGPDNREDLYIELAALIEPEVDADTVVIAPEYGAFGYHTSAKMLSSIGHNSKEMFQFLPAPIDQVTPYMNNAITQEMIDAFKPEYVLSLEAFIRRSLLRSPKFFEDYELIARRHSRVFSSKGLYLFRRKESKPE